MLHSYVPAVVFLFLGTAVGLIFTWANGALGPRRPSKVKSQPYESGLPSEIKSTFRFGISFYLVAMLFILFDIEAIFLYPWAVILRDLKMFGFWEMLVYIGIMLAGFFYVWKKGALDWGKPSARRGEV